MLFRSFLPILTNICYLVLFFNFQGDSCSEKVLEAGLSSRKKEDCGSGETEKNLTEALGKGESLGACGMNG